MKRILVCFAHQFPTVDFSRLRADYYKQFSIDPLKEEALGIYVFNGSSSAVVICTKFDISNVEAIADFAALDIDPLHDNILVIDPESEPERYYPLADTLSTRTVSIASIDSFVTSIQGLSETFAQGLAWPSVN